MEELKNLKNLKLEMKGNLTSEVGWMEEFDMWSWMDGGV